MSDELVVVEQTHVLPAVVAHEAMVARAEVSVEDVVAQRAKIEQVMHAVMVEGTHYGRIPGIAKPTLFKPGAEVLAVTFRFSPGYHSEREYDGPHLTVTSRCVLTHINSGLVIAEGEGLCTTRESKYAYRNAGRVCPNCGQPTIRKGKAQYGGGWFCSRKDGGCGENFTADDVHITTQDGGRVSNPDLPDTWNTVLKMANKRAFVAAILNGTAASDVFTQDVEDSGVVAAERHEYEPEPNDGRPAWNRPQSWQEISARLQARLGDDTSEWVAQMLDALYGDEVKKLADVPAEQLPDMADGLCRVIKTLDDADLDGFTPGVREIVQRAFAAAFAGLGIPGPMWRIDPEETLLPTKDEYEAARGTDAEPTPAPEPDADEIDIPFGSDD